jgi:hypothetical protein
MNGRALDFGTDAATQGGLKQFSMIRRSGCALHMDGTGLSDSTSIESLTRRLSVFVLRCVTAASGFALWEVIRRQARTLAECLQSGKRYRPYVDQW